MRWNSWEHSYSKQPEEITLLTGWSFRELNVVLMLCVPLFMQFYSFLNTIHNDSSCC